MTNALILLIDPSRESREMYAEYFRHHGHPVVEAADAAQGLKLTSERRPDLVVTELSEDPEWIHAVAALRKAGTAEETALIVCSTRLDPRWPYAPICFDADRSLPKPATPAQLLGEARKLLERRTNGGARVAEPAPRQAAQRASSRPLAAAGGNGGARLRA